MQTGVQTPNLNEFSITERAIITILLHTDMKLSYEDLGVMLGKEKATIRGQINAIKQKSEGVIEEVSEKNGKKRVFVPENIKEKLLKKAEEFKKEKYPNELVSKTIAILQNLDEYGTIWNTTYVMHSFKTLNMKISPENGKILHHSLESLMDFIKK